MSKLLKLLISLVATIVIAALILSCNKQEQNKLPLVAIANYGPHPSLFETIDGIKNHLKSQGYIEGENIRIIVSDVNYDTSLIMQMLMKLKAAKPDIFIALSTPVAQSAKNMITDIPVVFADVTDPIAAGLVDKKQSNIAGASDKQNITLMFDLAQQLLPKPEKMGILYSTGEANDKALITMLEKKASIYGIEIVAVPVEHSRDVTTRIRSFKNKVDFIYAGSSGVVQSAMPAISAAADDMKIALFNFNSSEVIRHQALASYGVSHSKVGANTAKIIIRLLNGENPKDIGVIYPSVEDHNAYVSKKKADLLGINIPASIKNLNIQE